jgi:proteasome lid subunit RPN8/RPN11
MEAVGLLGGRQSRITTAIPLPNIAGPHEFFADPRAQFLAFRSLKLQGEVPLAIYHSHPWGAPTLSASDIAFAQPSSLVQIVVAIHGAKLTDATFAAYWVRRDSGAVAEVELHAAL